MDGPKPMVDRPTSACASSQQAACAAASSPTVTSKEDLRRFMSEACPRAQEARRLRDEAMRIRRQIGLLYESGALHEGSTHKKQEEHEVSPPPPSDKAVLQEMEKWAFRELDKCIKACREAASLLAHTSTTHTMIIGKGEDSDVLNAKKVEKVRDTEQRAAYPPSWSRVQFG